MTDEQAECDHRFIRDGDVTREVMRDYSKTWAVYYCERCLKRRYALISDYNGYTGHRNYYDGSETVDRLGER